MRRKGFTLIELLVVIAIIALLVGILLPALARARQAARKTKSLANMKNFPTAVHGYLADNRGLLPQNRAVNYNANGTPTNVTNGWPWAFGGAYCDARFAGSPVDSAPANRPLNQYIVPDAIRDIEYAVTPATRGSLQLPVFESPGDKATIWDLFFNQSAPMAFNGVRSGYADVGTSYVMNDLYWQFWIPPGTPTNPTPDAAVVNAMRGVSTRLQSSSGDASKFVLFYDQVGFAFTRGPQNARWKGEFGEWNHSVMGFFDGRAADMEMEHRLIGGSTTTTGPAQFMASGWGFMYSGRTSGGLTIPSSQYSLVPPCPSFWTNAWGIGAN